MTIFPNDQGRVSRVLLLGGTSEIGLAILAALDAPAGTEVILAGRDEQRLAAAGKELPYQVRTVHYDAGQVGRHQALADGIFAEGPLDLVISAAGVLIPQADLERDVGRAAEMIETNFTGHVTTLLAIAARMRAQGRGTIVVLSQGQLRVRGRQGRLGRLRPRARGLVARHRRPRGPDPARIRHRPDDGGHAARAARDDGGKGRRGHRRRAAWPQGGRVGPGAAGRAGLRAPADPASCLAPCLEIVLC